MNATSWPSPGSSQSSWRPLTSSVAAGEREEAERQRVRERSQDDPTRSVAHATTSACGAASFIASAATELDRGLAFAALHHLEQLGVARALRGLADERPGDVALGGHQVEVLQVAQQAEAAVAAALEDLGVQPLRLVGRLLAVALGERRQRFGVRSHCCGEPLAGVEHVGLVAVGGADLAEGVGSSVSARCSRPR